MEFGPVIDAANNGVQPEWLDDDEKVMAIWSDEVDGGPYLASVICGWQDGFRIRLRADHPIYASRRFKAGDYVVALETGIDCIAGNVYVMQDEDLFTDDNGDERTIRAIPVRPATPAEIEQYKAENGLEAAYADTALVAQEIVGVEMVSLPMMTEDEAKAKARQWGYFCSGSDPEANEHYMGALRDFGLIRDETPIEAFEAHHGGLDDNQRDIIEIYQDWLDSQK